MTQADRKPKRKAKWQDEGLWREMQNRAKNVTRKLEIAAELRRRGPR